MRTLTPAAIAALAASEVFFVTLVRIDFPSGTIALNDSSYHLTWGGVTYLAAAGLGEISPTEDKPGEVTGANLELIRVDANYIGLALDDADEVQGSPVAIYTAVLNSALQIVDVVLDWAGYADTMPISEDGEHASIGLTAESKAVDLLRGSPLLYNDPDQQSLYPGDRFFEYVVSQSDKPVVWPTREWFHR